MQLETFLIEGYFQPLKSVYQSNYTFFFFFHEYGPKTLLGIRNMIKEFLCLNLITYVSQILWQEKLAKKRAEYTEKMKNKVAEVHKLAEEKRAFVEANRREECLKVEETAAKFRASGFIPKKFLRCFGS